MLELNQSYEQLILGLQHKSTPSPNKKANLRGLALSVRHIDTIDIVVRREGLEPPTHALEGHCSIQLSYRRILFIYL